VQLAVLGELPLLFVALFVWANWSAHGLAFDFTHAFLPAARHVVHGLDPYPSPHDPSVAAGTAFVYPPLVAFASAPLLLVPASIAMWLVTVAMIACLFGALWLLGVRDWRCYTVVLLWRPVLFAVQTANVSLPLLLTVAIAWRYRNRARVAAVAIGAGIAAKFIIWPLLVWLLATRRYRAVRDSTVAAAVCVFVPWALIGFAHFARYNELGRQVTRIEAPHGYTVDALAARLGIGGAGPALTLVLGLAILIACAIAGRRRTDETSFALAVVAVLLLSPIVWLHYFVLLAAIIAMTTKRFGPAWVAPILLWLCPTATHGNATNGTDWQLALAVVAPFALFAATRTAPIKTSVAVLVARPWGSSLTRPTAAHVRHSRLVESEPEA
jgi:hypothetical protein